MTLNHPHRRHVRINADTFVLRRIIDVTLLARVPEVREAAQQAAP